MTHSRPGPGTAAQFGPSLPPALLFPQAHGLLVLGDVGEQLLPDGVKRLMTSGKKL